MTDQIVVSELKTLRDLFVMLSFTKYDVIIKKLDFLHFTLLFGYPIGKDGKSQPSAAPAFIKIPGTTVLLRIIVLFSCTLTGKVNLFLIIIM
jgi:hypothetical protein